MFSNFIRLYKAMFSNLFGYKAMFSNLFGYKAMFSIPRMTPNILSLVKFSYEMGFIFPI